MPDAQCLMPTGVPMTMFAILEFDRNPLQLADLPGGLVSWLQSAGAVAVIGLVLYVLIGLPRLRPAERARVPRWQRATFLICSAAAAVLYVLWAILYLASPTPDQPPPT